MTAPPGERRDLSALEERASALAREASGCVVLVLIARVNAQGDHDGTRVFTWMQLGEGGVGRGTLLELLREYQHLEARRGAEIPHP